MISLLGRRAALQSASAARSTMVMRRTATTQLMVPAIASSRTSSLIGSTAFIAHRQLYVSPILAAANPQSGKPASDSVSHSLRNIKEESAGIRSSIENAVAGTSSSNSSEGSSSGASEIVNDAKSVVGDMVQRVPPPALLWGASGIVPYVTTAGVSVYLARQAQLVARGLDSHIDFETASALLLHAQNVQITFGAVLLSFLGAIHWGFEFSKYGGAVGNRRYLLGLLPVAIAWPTLLMTPQMALVTQWGGFVATWFIDLRATTAGWAPKWYSSYRFGLTLAVGLSIIATLAGTNYYDADESRSTQNSGVGHKLKTAGKDSVERTKETVQRIKDGKISTPLVKGKMSGPMQVEEADDEDGYVKIRNPEREEKERKEKEEEEKKKKQEEAEKKKKEKEGKKDDDDDDDE